MTQATVIVYPGITQVFKGKLAQSVHGGVQIHLAAGDLLQQVSKKFIFHAFSFLLQARGLGLIGPAGTPSRGSGHFYQRFWQRLDNLLH
jgi:hypothetical protein